MQMTVACDSLISWICSPMPPRSWLLDTPSTSSLMSTRLLVVFFLFGVRSRPLAGFTASRSLFYSVSFCCEFPTRWLRALQWRKPARCRLAWQSLFTYLLLCMTAFPGFLVHGLSQYSFFLPSSLKFHLESQVSSCWQLLTDPCFTMTSTQTRFWRDTAGTSTFSSSRPPYVRGLIKLDAFLARVSVFSSSRKYLKIKQNCLVECKLGH